VIRPLKIIIFVASGFIGILVLTALAILLLLDAESHRSRIQAAGSGALGMDVEIGGPMRFRFRPGLLVNLEDVHVRNRGMDVGSASIASLGVDLLPLLAGRIRITSITLQQPSLSIERGLDGTFNFERDEDVIRGLPALSLTQAAFIDGTLHYADKQSGDTLEARDCDLTLRGLQLPEEQGADLMERLSFTAKLACGEIQREAFMITQLALSATGMDGVLLLEPVTMDIFGGAATGHVRADYSAGVPRYDVRYSLPNFHIEAFFAGLAPRKIAEGLMTFTADLSMQGKTLNEIRQSMHGQISLRGDDLTLLGSDIDETYSRYESSQSFNLADLGAFFFAGPLGVVVTKGYEFASIVEGSGGSTTIRTLVSDWNVEAGVANAQDVAMATIENRIALKGQLDLANEEFISLSMALIDSDGCVKVEQKILGTFRQPVVEQPNVLKSFFGPALELLRRGVELIAGDEDCDVFYTGSVLPPAGSGTELHQFQQPQ
jgi:uncharacterized protein involved in outer membrane biogenesis